MPKPIDKLDEDRAWRDQLDPTCLDEVDGPEVVAEANHYEAALRAALLLHRPCTADGCTDPSPHWCLECENEEWPCATAWLITRELAGDHRRWRAYITDQKPPEET